MSWLDIRRRSDYMRMIGVGALVFMSVGLTAPLYSNYVVWLGANTSQVGLIFAFYQIASLASQYWWGQRSDRLGKRKPLILIGLSGLALGVLGTSNAPSYEWLFPIRILEGLAFAAYSTGNLALLGDILEGEERRGRLVGSYRMFGSLAFAPASLAGGWIADQLGLRMPFLLSMAFILLALILVSRIREESRDQTAELGERGERARQQHGDEGLSSVEELSVEQTDQQGHPSTLSADLSAPVETQNANGHTTSNPSQASNPQQRLIIAFLLLTFAWFFGMGSVVSLWPVYMRANGYSQTIIGGLWALAALGEVGALLLAGNLADKLGRKPVILFGVSGMACIYLAYTIAPSLAWFIPIQMIRSLTYASFEAPAMLYATELGLRQQRGRLAGLYFSASGLGGVLGSALGGWMAQALGMPSMFRLVATVMLVIALLMLWFMPRRGTREVVTA